MSTISAIASPSIARRELIRAATLAPSADNNQPWKFAEVDNRLLVYLDHSQCLPSDVRNMFDLTAVGAAVENIRIAASHDGAAADVTFNAGGCRANAVDAEPVATIAFTPGAEPDGLYACLEQRCTCRKPYSTQPIDSSSLATISRETAALSSVQLDWVTERSAIRALARIVAASDAVRFAYQPFHAELYRQLRFSPQAVEETRDGLDVRTLELPWGAAVPLHWLRRWSRMQLIRRLGLGILLTAPSARLVRASGALGVLSVTTANEAEFFAGGRALQRAWLAATAAGLSMHPLGSLSIFLLHVAEVHPPLLNSRHRRQLSQLQARVEKTVPQARGRTLQLLFRIGKSAAPSGRSLRRHANEVLQQN